MPRKKTDFEESFSYLASNYVENHDIELDNLRESYCVDTQEKDYTAPKVPRREKAKDELGYQVFTNKSKPLAPKRAYSKHIIFFSYPHFMDTLQTTGSYVSVLFIT